MEEKLATISFSFYPVNHEFYYDTYLNYSVHEDMDIHELQRLCKRFALAMGFTESTVDAAFGEDCY